jgi:hypothetical protein
VSQLDSLLYVDGTFRSVLKFFHPVFAVHGLKSGHCVPSAFFLLTNKHQTSREVVFRYAVAEAAKLGVNVCVPQLFMLISKPLFTKQ